jgi:pimeloyl-ACP methyl ester carboxylesterase
MVLAIGVVLGAVTARADTSVPVAPCAGCLLDLPDASGPVSLVVVLHGDLEHASKWFERWSEATRARGWGLLALQCPEDLGCEEGRWYRWNGNPNWVTDQVAEVSKHVELDPAQTFLVGWSGGATYVGQHSQAWGRKFSGLVIHGGGGAPASRRCPRRALPAYFLVGDENQFHAYARQYRAYLERCGSKVLWDVNRGADHLHEDMALDTRKANEILDWLVAQATTEQSDK